MLSMDLYDGFELIEVRGSRNTDLIIRISSDKRRFTIPSKYMKELGWKDKERVNLKGKGETFMLEPSKVGLITIHGVKGSSGQITSTNFNLEILSRTKSCREFEGWTEGDVLFFKPKRGEK